MRKVMYLYKRINGKESEQIDWTDQDNYPRGEVQREQRRQMKSSTAVTAEQMQVKWNFK